jgi:hypothetical protein
MGIKDELGATIQELNRRLTLLESLHPEIKAFSASLPKPALELKGSGNPAERRRLTPQGPRARRW